jgi:hypothetical protein
MPSLSLQDATAARTVLRTERENLIAELEALEMRITEERDSARAVVHVPSLERIQHIQRYETSATREFHRLIEQLLQLQKERSKGE